MPTMKNILHLGVMNILQFFRLVNPGQAIVFIESHC